MGEGVDLRVELWVDGAGRAWWRGRLGFSQS